MNQLDQPELFDADVPPLPEGFKYQLDLISADKEQQLVRQIETLPLKEFEFHGFTGNGGLSSRLAL